MTKDRCRLQSWDCIYSICAAQCRTISFPQLIDLSMFLNIDCLGTRKVVISLIPVYIEFSVQKLHDIQYIINLKISCIFLFVLVPTYTTIYTFLNTIM